LFVTPYNPFCLNRRYFKIIICLLINQNHSTSPYLLAHPYTSNPHFHKSNIAILVLFTMPHSTTLILLSVFLSLFVTPYAFMLWYNFRTIFSSQDTFVECLPYQTSFVHKFSAMVLANWWQTRAAVATVLDVLGIKRRNVRAEKEKEERWRRRMARSNTFCLYY